MSKNLSATTSEEFYARENEKDFLCSLDSALGSGMDRARQNPWTTVRDPRAKD